MDDDLNKSNDNQSNNSAPNTTWYKFGANYSQLSFPFLADELNNNSQKKVQDRVILHNNDGHTLTLHKVAYDLLMELDHSDSSASVEITQQDFDQVNDTLTCFCIILCMGGYFSGGIWKADRWLVHKSFHRYMPSSKGKPKTSTSNKDSKPQYNETKHKKEIESVITHWKTNHHFEGVSTIFVLAPGKNRSFLLGKEGVLSTVMDLKEEPTDTIRVRRFFNECFGSQFSLGMPVSEASFRELERACKNLISYQFKGI